jgi:hypothetical protein
MQAIAKPLSGPLRSRINQLAHAQAIGHETRLRASLLEQITAARDGGSTYDELIALVDTLATA